MCFCLGRVISDPQIAGARKMAQQAFDEDRKYVQMVMATGGTLDRP